jgi:hypothetical protein
MPFHVAYVAFMLRGTFCSPCKSLKMLGTGLQHMRHENALRTRHQTSRFAFNFKVVGEVDVKSLSLS